MTEDQEELLLKAEQSLAAAQRYLIEAQNLRTTGDYGQFEAVAQAQALAVASQAAEFLQMARSLMS